MPARAASAWPRFRSRRRAGAKVFATAGSPEKREFLKSLGVQHVFDSRSLAFAEEVLQITDRRGVDLVLNSLPGEAIAKSLSILGAYGRFLEIGKIDIYQNRSLGLYPFQNNLSYFAIDLDRLLRERPEVVRSMFVELAEEFVAGHYRPLERTTFGVPEVVSAFRYLAQRKNIGKVVVSLVAPSQGSEEESASGIRADGSYLVTGGLGALGLQLATWLVRRGARSLLLMGRRDPTPAAQETLDQLRQQGVDVRVLKADVARAEELDRALAEVRAEVPPLRGVFHAAGMLDDGILVQLDAQRLSRVMAPKVRGAWNLHRATADQQLDLFVLFSSVASLLGSPGQGNYAAGNMFLDALAHQRRRDGLPALAINWGPWAESGMAAAGGQNDRLSGHGMHALPSADALTGLERLLQHAQPQVALMRVDWEQLFKAYPRGVPPVLKDLGTEVATGDKADDGLRRQVLATPAAERQSFLEARFIEKLAQVIELDPAKIDPEQPLNTLGLDSLMAIELKNGIETGLNVVLPMAKFMEGPSVSQLALCARGDCRVGRRRR